MGQAIESFARSVATLLWPSILILAIVLFTKQIRAILERIAQSEKTKVVISGAIFEVGGRAEDSRHARGRHGRRADEG
jgi:hypothetical protein